MKDVLAPLTGLDDHTTGAELPLPPELAAFYGPLRLDAPRDRPYLFANFVSTLDGVVALGEPGTGGDEISGGSRQDRAVMGLLRAACDMVIVGAGTLRAFPRHLWTPEAIHAPSAAAYTRLRTTMGRPQPPLAVIVSASGDLDPALPVFSSGRAPAAIVTTPAGARTLQARGGGALDIRVVDQAPRLTAADVLRAAAPAAGSRVLLECGPSLMATFFEGGAVDELFLTLAPQIAGRAPGVAREGLVAGALFLPDRPVWGELTSTKRGGSLLFLRYRFSAPPAK